MFKRIKGSSLILLFILLTACGSGEDHSHDSHDSHDDHSADGSNAAVKTLWELAPNEPQPESKAVIGLKIADEQGEPIEEFMISHEKPMHLIVISRDLSYFDHLHPEYESEGRFTVATQFPRGGDYKLIADFVLEGSGPLTEDSWIRVNGEAANHPIEADQSLVRSVDGKEVSLSFDKLAAGKALQMTFTFKDALTKQPITDLQPYLGAVGHVVIVSADLEQYIHNHPIDEKAAGPDAVFETKFPTSGIYKIWGQFQHEGKLFVVPFVVKVP